MIKSNNKVNNNIYIYVNSEKFLILSLFIMDNNNFYLLIILFKILKIE